MYFVWRRDDGYIGASNSSSRTQFNGLARTTGNTIEVLLETESWPTAFIRIVDERLDGGPIAGPVSDLDRENYDLFKSWA